MRACFVDSTVDALMAIDDSQLMSSPNTSGNSRIIATAIVHSQPKKEQLKDHIDLNNNGQQGAKKIDSIESENSDDAFEDEEANDDRAKLTQKDIDDLKSELKKAQEEVRKARLEAEEEKQKLEPIQEGGKPSINESIESKIVKIIQPTIPIINQLTSQSLINQSYQSIINQSVISIDHSSIWSLNILWIIKTSIIKIEHSMNLLVNRSIEQPIFYSILNLIN